MVAIARRAVTRRKRMRQAAQPFAQQLIDLGCRQAIAKALRQLGVGTGLDSVVDGLERHATLGKLPLEILVAIDVELGIVREVGAELEEERPEVLIDAVEIVVVDHRGGFHDPRIGSPRPRAAATLRAHHPRLLLGLADIEHAFGPLEAPQALLRDVVLALPLAEGHQVDAFAVDELLDRTYERLGHRRHRRRRRKSLAPVDAQVAHHRPHRLQRRHIDVEVHPVDPLDLQHHMVTQDVRHRSCYAHRGLQSSTGPRTHRASSSHIQGMSLQARPESTFLGCYPPFFAHRRPSHQRPSSIGSRNIHMAPAHNAGAASFNEAPPQTHPLHTPRRSEAEPR